MMRSTTAPDRVDPVVVPAAPGGRGRHRRRFRLGRRPRLSRRPRLGLRRFRVSRHGWWLVVVTLLVLAAAMAVTVNAVAGQAGSPVHGSGQWRQIVVRPGDTLWLIATRELPGVAPYQAVDEIRQLNGIEDFTVRPGQHLLLPTVR
jgi:LysM domain-containing protein